jgi:hypothetical protein
MQIAPAIADRKALISQLDAESVDSLYQICFTWYSNNDQIAGVQRHCAMLTLLGRLRYTRTSLPFTPLLVG